MNIHCIAGGNYYEAFSTGFMRPFNQAEDHHQLNKTDDFNFDIRIGFLRPKILTFICNIPFGFVSLPECLSIQVIIIEPKKNIF